MSDDAQIAQGNQCAVCFDHGDSSGSGRLVKAHEGCIDRLEAEREWARKIYRLLWTERGEILERAKAAEAERDRLRGVADAARALVSPGDSLVAMDALLHALEMLDAVPGGHQ